MCVYVCHYVLGINTHTHTRIFTYSLNRRSASALIEALAHFTGTTHSARLISFAAGGFSEGTYIKRKKSSATAQAERATAGSAERVRKKAVYSERLNWYVCVCACTVCGSWQTYARGGPCVMDVPYMCINKLNDAAT